MSRDQVNNATGDSFFIWDRDVLVVNILGKPSASKLPVVFAQGTLHRQFTPTP